MAIRRRNSIDIATAIEARTAITVAPARISTKYTHSFEDNVYITHWKGKTILCRENEDFSLNIQMIDWEESDESSIVKITNKVDAIMKKTGLNVPPDRIEKLSTYSAEKVYATHHQSGKSILLRACEGGNAFDVRVIDWNNK